VSLVKEICCRNRHTDGRTKIYESGGLTGGFAGHRRHYEQGGKGQPGGKGGRAPRKSEPIRGFSGKSG